MFGTWTIVCEVSKSFVNVKCGSCGLETQKRKSKLHILHRCPSIIDNKKYCYKCQHRKSLDFFHKDASVAGGFSKICKDCYAERVGVLRSSGKPVQRRTNISNSTEKQKHQTTKESYKNLAVYFKKRESALKYKSISDGTPFNLSDGYLLSIYNQQDGKCYYTGMPVINHLGGIDNMTISIDKLTPELGYVEGNVVICCFCVNSFKGTRTEIEFKIFLEAVLPKLQEYLTKII